MQAIYQAHRLKGCLSVIETGQSILEIGGGMGRTAYYAHRLDMVDYTIVDLPLALVGQACFLAGALGEDAVSLHGESRAGICLRPPQWLKDNKRRFDIALNVDSLTEMSREYAEYYLSFIRTNCRSFLSINHEANDFTTQELAPDLFASRMPYPMRRGYVEEFALLPKRTLFWSWLSSPFGITKSNGLEHRGLGWLSPISTARRHRGRQSPSPHCSGRSGPGSCC